jgi:hypothetical protein
VGEAPGVHRPERRFDPDLAEQSFFVQCVSAHGENVYRNGIQSVVLFRILAARFLAFFS